MLSFILFALSAEPRAAGALIPPGLYQGGSPWFVVALESRSSRTRLMFWFEEKVNGPVVSESYDLIALPSSHRYRIAHGGASCGTAEIRPANGILTIRYGATFLKVAPTDRTVVNTAIHQVADNQRYARLRPNGSATAWYYGSALPKCTR